MYTRRLGKTDLKVADVSMGCWAIGGLAYNLGKGIGWSGTEDIVSQKALFTAYDIGANYFDTADVYGLGKSEQLLGTLISKVKRESLIIGSKVGYFKGTSIHPYHPLNMRNQLEMSLQNLRTDYLDIYDFHNLYFGDQDEYKDDAISTMMKFKEEGKIRFIGLRFGHRYRYSHKKENDIEKKSVLKEFLETASLVNPDIVKSHFSILTPLEFLSNIFEWASQKEVGLVFYKPFEQGILLKKYNNQKMLSFDKGDIRKNKKLYSQKSIRIMNYHLEKLLKYFNNNIEELVRICVQYPLSFYRDSTVLCGFKNPEQVLMNFSNANKPLSAELLVTIRETMKKAWENLD